MDSKLFQVRFVFVSAALLALLGCPGNEEGRKPPVGGDTGGDSSGLEDDDIDGDGLTNAYETGLFNPSANPYKFNPQIADLPQLRVQLMSPPKIVLDVQSSVTTATQITTGATVETASTVTSSQTTTNTTAVETSVSHTLKKSDAFLFGPLITNWMNNTGGQSITRSTTTTEEESFSWTAAQSNENRLAYNQSRTISAEQGFTYSGGKLMVTVKIVNSGHMAFTLSNLILSATRIDPYSDAVAIPIGNLELDTNQSTFPATTIAPGAEVSGIVFIKEDLDLATAQALLRSTNGLVIAPTLYELLDENGVAFAHNMTEVNAKTALVIIDYGPTVAKAPRNYFVSTRATVQQQVSMDTILSDVLAIPYVDANGLSALDEVSEELTVGGKKGWVVIHYSWASGVQQVAAYSRLDGDYAGFAELMIGAGDVVQFVFMDDIDGDEVGARTEAIFGSDPADADSDDDGLDDGVEVFGIAVPGVTMDERELFLNPLVLDTDGDGVDDAAEVAQGRDPTSAFPVRSNLGNTTSQEYEDEINAMVATLDGGVLVAGASDRHYTEPAPGAYLVHSTWEVKKYRADGSEDTAWRHTISGPGGDGANSNAARALALGENGSVYLVGYVSGPCNIAAEENWYVTKLTSPGTEAASGWRKQLDFDGNSTSVCLSDRANAVAVDSTGNVYVAGYATTNQTHRDKDWTIKKYLPDGTEVTTGWNKREVAAATDEEVLALAVDGNGTIYAVGYVEDQVAAASGRDIQIVAYNASGTEVGRTALEFDANGQDRVSAIAIHGTRLFVAGSASATKWALKAVVRSTLAEDAAWYKSGTFQQRGHVGAMSIDAGGRVVLVIDSQQTGYAQRWLFKRYDAAGAEDADWNFYVSVLSQSNHFARALALHPDGSLYFGGDLELSNPLFSYEWYVQKTYIDQP